MRKIEIKIFFIISICLGIVTNGQISNDIPNLVPPSPSAFGFSVYNSNFQNTPSGNYNYVVPIYKLQLDNITIPVFLSYTSGVKIDDVGGNLGTSWGLNAGGIITRVVRNLADEEAPKRWVPSNIDIVNDYNKIKEAALPGDYVDTEFDWFNFNVSNGINGSFYMDENLNPIYKGDDYKIEISYIQDTKGTRFLQFIITDKLGNKYFFGGNDKLVERTKLMSSDDSGFNVSNPKPEYATAWYLYKIETPSRKKINFDYEKDIYKFYSSASSSLSVEQKCACTGFNGEEYETKIINHKTLSSVSGSRIVRISTDKETVNFHYDKIRNDVMGGKLLNSIVIQSLNGKQISNYTLSYLDIYSNNVESYYFTSSNQDTRYRYFLSNIINIINKEKYSFEYYNPADLPARFSLSSDYYGYFNNYTNNKPFPTINNFNSTDIREVVKIISNKVPSNYLSANKEVNPNTVFYGNLRKISYPTGGSATIFYEPNCSTEKIPSDSYSYLSLEAYRLCGEPIIKEKKATFVSNGEDIYLTASASTDYFNCGEPDNLHDIYSISIKDLSTGSIIWSKNKKVSEGNFETSEVACIQGNVEHCPIKTVLGRTYEVTFSVSSKFGEIFGALSVKYNKITEFQDKTVNYAGARVSKIVDNDIEGAEYTKKFIYNLYKDKDLTRCAF
ncbi:hypothetical protein [Riemerella anatipestifer]|uniref:hypothetical protein n=2 Tax=Riemerella anatipestifer TaxID=34085 RepID=UPI00210B3503|nr:hypothetical protein [Riemerella anatipestifer]MCQ4039945.1 hypothetical protein [Riemerella anatipestifer]MCT6761569.1 hypothetical protein [Riemerella anatipestifer]MCT6765536.1 hypothetical protein [Riemerella anatipestifer]MCT6769748.1 hypothetical protein [Riemerella anatipestifer]MCT6773801.1 hypothetical protein [Riemerella anatipestifer]